MAGWFDRLRGLVGSKQVQQITPTDYQFGSGIEKFIEHAITSDGQVNATRAMEFYRTSSVVSTSIEIIAKKLQNMPVVVERDGEIITDDPILELLAKPNDHETYRMFMGSSARHFLLTGNLYWNANGNPNSPPLEIYNVHPTDISPNSTVDDGFPERYHVGGLLANGNYVREPVPGQPNGVRFLREDDLWHLYHLKDYTSRVNKLTGDSPLESVISEIRQHILGNRHNSSTLSRGARLSMLFAIKEDLPREVFDSIEKDIVNRYGGADKAGSVGVIAASELDVHEFGVNNKDMDYVNLIELVKTSVFARYNIPLPLVLSSRQTFSNYKEAVLALYDDAVLPALEYILDGLTDFLFPRYGRDPRQERLTYNPRVIIALRERLIEELRSLSELNILTTNEKRQLLPDLEDIEGGDVLMAPGTLAPIAGQGIDPAVMMQEDREAQQEAQQVANEALQASSDKDRKDDKD